MVVFWEFCTKALIKLCPKIFLGYEMTEWLEEQGNESYEMMKSWL
jgi:hypothetical protein